MTTTGNVWKMRLKVFHKEQLNPGLTVSAGTVTSPVYNTDRLSFNTTCRWMVRGFKNGRSSDSPVWHFTTAQGTDTYCFTNKQG